jgi:hypothetical protein
MFDGMPESFKKGGETSNSNHKKDKSNIQCYKPLEMRSLCLLMLVYERKEKAQVNYSGLIMIQWPRSILMKRHNFYL